MSFAEFQIRLFAWERTEARAWEKIRVLAWHTMAGSPNAPKRMPSLEKFMPLVTDNPAGSSKISEAQKQRFLEASAEYYKQINAK